MSTTRPQVGDSTNLLLKKLVTATQALSEGGGVFLTEAEADALYFRLDGSNNPFTATSTAVATVRDGFSLTSLGSIGLAAGGANKNITLTPSGTGSVRIAFASPVVAPPLQGIHVIASSGTDSGLTVDGFGAPGGFDAFGQGQVAFRKARGSASSLSAVQNNDFLGEVGAAGYNGSAYTSNRAVIRFLASQNWTGSAQGTRFNFQVTPLGATSPTAAMEISAPTSTSFFWEGGNGNLAIAPNGASRTLSLQTTTAGGTATTFLSADASQNATFAHKVTINASGGTTSADALAFGTDSLLFRTAAGTLNFQPSSGNGTVSINTSAATNTGLVLNSNQGGGGGGIQSVSAGADATLNLRGSSVVINTAGTTAATINNSQNLILSPGGTTAFTFSGSSGAGTITGGAGNMTITAGTGPSRTLTLQTTTSGSAATTAVTIDAAQQVKAVKAVVVNNGGTTVANLPAAASNQGGFAFVTDATLTAITGLGLAVTGGGANKVPVYSDGTNWIII